MNCGLLKSFWGFVMVTTTTGIQPNLTPPKHKLIRRHTISTTTQYVDTSSSPGQILVLHGSRVGVTTPPQPERSQLSSCNDTTGLRSPSASRLFLRHNSSSSPTHSPSRSQAPRLALFKVGIMRTKCSD